MLSNEKAELTSCARASVWTAGWGRGERIGGDARLRPKPKQRRSRRNSRTSRAARVRARSAGRGTRRWRRARRGGRPRALRPATRALARALYPATVGVHVTCRAQPSDLLSMSSEFCRSVLWKQSDMAVPGKSGWVKRAHIELKKKGPAASEQFTMSGALPYLFRESGI